LIVEVEIRGIVIGLLRSSDKTASMLKFLKFFKVTGAGNNFLIVDLRSEKQDGFA